MSNIETPQPVHEGKNLKRIREMLQVKQATLAQQLGSDWNQKKISQLEDKEIIDPAILEEVANALHITPEAIKNFSEEAAISVVQNNYEGSNNQGTNLNYKCSFNPLDKVVQLYDEKIELYERMLKDKNQMIEKLEGLLKNK